jgi:hypothetical protein
LRHPGVVRHEVSRMKKDASRTPSQPRQVPARHQFEHQVPTVIHGPEENMMVLARWTHRAMKDPVKFWGAIAAIVAGLLALVVLSNVVWTGSSANTEVWTKMESVKSPADRVQLAEEYPGSAAATWARLQAATEYYNQGFADLPNNRDVALPNLQKAVANFDEVTKEAPKDSPQARAAAFGKARALEARNELPKAIEQYDLVVKTWPESAEAAEAKKLAAALKQPEAVAFYKELYAYSPTRVTLPPLSTQDFNMPLMPAPGFAKPGTLPAEASPAGLLPSIPLPPPPPSPVTKGQAAPSKTSDAGKTAGPTAPVPSSAGLPEDPFDPGSTPTVPASPPPGAPKAAAAKAEPKPAPAAPKAESPKS